MTGEASEQVKAALAEVPLDRLAELDTNYGEIIAETRVGLTLLVPRDYRELLKQELAQAQELRDLVRAEIARWRDARGRGLES